MTRKHRDTQGKVTPFVETETQQIRFVSVRALKARSRQRQRSVWRTLSRWILLTCGLLLWSQSAVQAQGVPSETAFQVQQFRPWTDPQGMFQTQSARTLGQWNMLAAMYFNYARDPLTLRNPGDRSSFENGQLLNNQLAADVVLSIGLLSMLDFALTLPVTLYQTGAIPSRQDVFGNNAGRDLSGTTLSDIKAGLKVAALQESTSSIGLGFQAYVGIPSGNTQNFNGEDGVSFGISALISKQISRLRFAFNLGYRYLPATQFLRLQVNHELYYATAASFRVLSERLDLVGELSGSLGVSDLSAQAIPLDLYAGVRFYPLTDVNLALNLGIGVPLALGYGSPLVRVLFGVVWSNQPRDFDGDGVVAGKDDCPDIPGPTANKGCPWQDTDGDGLKDNRDRCPRKAGPKKNQGCPWQDRDGDGVKDNQDRCPNVAGPPANKGCPWPDQDKDGIRDSQDRCPTKKGPLANKGCPDQDRDGDRVVDRLDKCPDVPGAPRLKGCPIKLFVTVTSKEIKILQKIYFQFNSAKLDARSFPVLNQVYSVLNSNPSRHIRIEGHTDNIGTPTYNMQLSQKRAEAVRLYLIGKGVDHFRLTAKGFGRTVPIADNDTPEGRARNRRVEFKITTK